MIDRQKAIEAFIRCGIPGACSDKCAYFSEGFNCYRAMKHDLLELLKEQPEQKFFVDSDGKITPLPIQPQWISVEDRMPPELHSMWFPLYGTSKWKSAMWREESDHVLVAITFEDGSQFVTSGYTQDGKWSTGISKMLPYTVTHWMQMPEPPEVKQDD